jgi:hypothetical protein
MTKPKGGPNEASVKRTLAALRRSDQLGELGECIGVLALTAARLTDDVVASDTPAYATAKIVTVYLGVLATLVKTCGRPVGGDRWDQFFADLSKPSYGSSWDGE